MTFDRITIEPGKMHGQPCLRGLRITVKQLLQALAVLGTREELLRQYPDLEAEDIRQSLLYGAAMIADEEVALAKPFGAAITA